MKRHWMHIIASTFCIFCLGLILMSIYWLLFIFDKITDYNYGNYTFRYDYSRDDAYFEYELIDHNIYNKNITKSDAKNYSLVKNYYKKNNNIFFSYINGDYYDGYCYYESKLYFGKIDLERNILQDNISINKYSETYKKLSNLNVTQQKWLNSPKNRCPQTIRLK
ncbi:hypothetical protein [Snodgrassella alvi]|uniref:hypothetical protein n=1 Tax=Snodgrassella alvi TaxID=1196083 RepID=UPI000C1E323A|nr:hypothetical protein [Snodgrassella alvi]PIT41081.1 hypothetical protein BHC53_06835 [Snodgrassella alvi]